MLAYRATGPQVRVTAVSNSPYPLETRVYFALLDAMVVKLEKAHGA